MEASEEKQDPKELYPLLSSKYPLGSTQNRFSGVQQPDLLKINPDFRGMLWMQGLVPVEGLLGTATLVLCAKKWGHHPIT